MGLLNWKRGDVMVGHPIVSARKTHPFAAKQTFHDGCRFCQSVDPDGAPAEIQASLFIFRSNAASAQAEFQTSVREKINCRGLSRDQHGMAKVVIENVRAEP